MILVDTSVWIDHFRNCNSILSDILQSGNVMCHSFVIGELACGNLRNRKEILSLLSTLPQTGIAESPEILYFIEENELMGLGIGLIDIHLLASTLLENVKLWTLDKRLKNVASKLHISFSESKR